MTDRVRALAIEHLLLRLQPIHRALRVAVEARTRASARLARPESKALCVTADHVRTLLGDVDQLSAFSAEGSLAAALTASEEAMQAALRARAAASGSALPLDRLRAVFRLEPFELDAILLCAAPELDQSYERIVGYIHDDLNCRYPSAGLLAEFTAANFAGRLARRAALGPHGKLRRYSLLEARGEASTELRQELRASPPLIDFLTGCAPETLSVFRDPTEVTLPALVMAPPEVEAAHMTRIAQGLRDGVFHIAGIWGTRQAGRDEAVAALSAAARMPLRQFPLEVDCTCARGEARLRDIFVGAAHAGALLWLDCDPLTTVEREGLRDHIAEALVRSPVPILLSGVHPWRPTTLLEHRAFIEFELDGPDHAARRAMWAEAIPPAAAARSVDLASRFHMSGAEIRAVARVAEARSRLLSNGVPAPVEEQIDAACTAVIHRDGGHFTTRVKPKRGPEDLVLPAELHRQVLEVGSFFLSTGRVYEEWGFGRIITGRGGLKALFTGDPGTGKTLAAEVIAGRVGLPLLKVELSRVVSKWVGETEKNLESVFKEAEDSHSVLFFDEADSLFGKRGEVRHGTDRYANLEIGYLLQRLEEYHGLAILASNLKDQIDPAFLRRFQVVLHFPMPGPCERRRIWEVAFSGKAPVEGSVQFESLGQLEMTGAAIVSSACTAALIAADEGAGRITMGHVVRAIARQYTRESRILNPAQLGPYAALTQAPTRAVI